MLELSRRADNLGIQLLHYLYDIIAKRILDKRIKADRWILEYSIQESLLLFNRHLRVLEPLLYKPRALLISATRQLVVLCLIQAQRIQLLQLGWSELHRTVLTLFLKLQNAVEMVDGLLLIIWPLWIQVVEASLGRGATVFEERVVLGLRSKGLAHAALIPALVWHVLLEWASHLI